MVTEQIEKSDPADLKLVFEFLKHLTTLSSGSVLIVLTLAEKLFKLPFHSADLLVALCAFLLSIVFALTCMAILSFTIGTGDTRRVPVNRFSLIMALSAVSFLCGMLFVALAVWSQHG